MTIVQINSSLLACSLAAPILHQSHYLTSAVCLHARTHAGRRMYKSLTADCNFFFFFFFIPVQLNARMNK
jgi:hypothetical protein